MTDTDALIILTGVMLVIGLVYWFSAGGQK